jgi:hypothetical protein
VPEVAAALALIEQALSLIEAAVASLEALAPMASGVL